MVSITYEKHQFNATLVAGESIAIYINGEPTAIEYTVGTGNSAIATFTFQESIEQ